MNRQLDNYNIYNAWRKKTVAIKIYVTYLDLLMNVCFYHEKFSHLEQYQTAEFSWEAQHSVF